LPTKEEIMLEAAKAIASSEAKQQAYENYDVNENMENTE